MKGYVLHGMMILLGLMLIITYSYIIKDIQDIKSTVGQAASGVYTLGIMILTIGATLMLTSTSKEVSTAYVTYLSIALGVVLIVLGAILVDKTDGNAKSWSIIVLVIGLILIVGCAVSLYSVHGDKLKAKLKSKLSSSLSSEGGVTPEYQYGCGMY
jgi:hypothetical protein